MQDEHKINLHVKKDTYNKYSELRTSRGHQSLNALFQMTRVNFVARLRHVPLPHNIGVS
jgi:hypothetical protein